MCVTARTELTFACIVITEQWETSFHVLVMTIWLWLNIYQETLMNKDQIKGRVEEVKGKVKGDICAVTLSRFTGEKGADISSQNIFLDDSLTRHLTILGAEYRKNSSEPVFRR